jgi:phosphonate transport system substrate-binding protein
MMRSLLSFKQAALGAFALAGCATMAGAQTPSEINFGVISTEASVNQKKNWEPFVEAISKGTGLKVKAFYATDYAGVIEAMRFSKVHLAWFGNKILCRRSGRGGTGTVVINPPAHRRD